MLTRFVVSIVKACTRFAVLIVAIAALVSVASGYYVVQNFNIDTDVNKLISPDLDWRKRDIAFDKDFDQDRLILAVVEGPTPEFASAAADALTNRLMQNTTNFTGVRRLDGGAFFDKNGLLFQSKEEVGALTKQLSEATPLLEILAGDPSIRGLTGALETGLMGVRRGELTLDATAQPFNKIAAAIDDNLKNGKGDFSWRGLVDDNISDMDKRGFIEVKPVLDFAALEPGKAATDAIRAAATELNLAGQYGARVRLTGPVPIADEEFVTVQEGAVLNSVVTVLLVLLVLWAALHSSKLIFAVFVTLISGLLVTTALGLIMVGALNPLSIAFAVLFIGLGVDFGIQYSVRYRSERFKDDDIERALLRAAKRSSVPLALAAMATSVGFLSFLPTDYKGVSELGKIAGVGMLVAFLFSISVLPALIKLLNPAGEKDPVGWKFLAPVDDFLENYRVPIISITLGLTVLGLPLLYFMHFDFNPMNLRSAKVESIATYLDLRKDPKSGASAVNVMAPTLDAAREVQARLAKVPEVARTMSLEFFVPTEQPEKLALISEAAEVILPALNPDEKDAAPTDEENIKSLQLAAASLRNVAEGQKGPGATAAARLAEAFDRTAAATPAVRAQVQDMFVRPMQLALNQLAGLLTAEPVTLETLPASLVASWKTSNGQYRVEVLPSGDPNDNDTLRNFSDAVLKAEPTALGGPISIQKSGDTIVTAFIHAGIWALLAISLLLWITLRRISDVLMTMIPLLVAGIVTLEICVLIGLSLNFANIIAVPLLLGVGVAFKIYYVTAWRAGKTKLLQSSLTRAIFYSALTTAIAFGSLSLSSHPGTASMGKLLALSFVITLAAVLLFQPALMGKPRNAGE